MNGVFNEFLTVASGRSTYLKHFLTVAPLGSADSGRQSLGLCQTSRPWQELALFLDASLRVFSRLTKETLFWTYETTEIGTKNVRIFLAGHGTRILCCDLAAIPLQTDTRY